MEHVDSSAPPDYSNARSAFFWRCGSNLTVKRLRELPQRIWGVAAQRGFIHLRLVNEPGSPLPAVDHAGTRLRASSGFKEKQRKQSRRRSFDPTILDGCQREMMLS